MLGNYLWSVVRNNTYPPDDSIGESVKATAVIRFSMTTHQWERVANYPESKGNGVYGAQYGFNNGTLYASDNDNGFIYGFDLINSNIPPFKVSDGPRGGPNDGARCVQNLVM